MCKALNLNRSTYYKALKYKTQIGNEQLDSKLLKVYYASKRRSGAPAIFNVLRNEGQTASLKRIQRRMAFLGINSVIVKKYKPVKAEKNREQKSICMKWYFTAASINLKWCTYITYIHTEKDGRIYPSC